LANLPKGSTKSGRQKNEIVVKAGDTLWKIAERKTSMLRLALPPDL